MEAQGLLTVAEVASYLSRSRAMIYRLIQDADDPLPCVEVGTRSKRFRREDVDLWLAGRTRAAS